MYDGSSGKLSPADDKAVADFAQASLDRSTFFGFGEAEAA
jgi:hypothetical protein